MVRMAAASTFLLIAALVVPTASASAAESAAGPYDPPTVPELMDRFGLPRALLPATARRYLLHDDGSFQLFLDGGCVAEAGGYRVGYGVKLSGAVAPGRATGLGASASACCSPGCPSPPSRWPAGGHRQPRPDQEVVPGRRVQVQPPLHRRRGDAGDGERWMILD